MGYLTYFVHGLCFVLTAFLFFQLFLEQKPTWKPSGIILLLSALGAVFMLAGYGVALLFSANYFVQSIAFYTRTIIILFAVMLPLLGRTVRQVLLVIVFVFLSTISELLGGTAYSLIFSQPFTTITPDPLAADSMALLASTILFSIVVVLQYVFLGIRYDRSDPEEFKHVQLLELIIPLVSVVLVCVLVSLQQEAAVYAGTFVLTLGLLAFLLYSIYQKQLLVQKEQELQQKHKELHYEELERHQAEIRAIKHDMKNQLIAMGAFVKSGDTERADKQLGAIIQQLEENSKYFFTDNAGVNGLLVRKYKEAGESGIECEFGIRLPATTGFADVDLTVLLGNILDNALEACRLCDGKRSIRLEVLSGDEVLIVRSENSTDGKTQSIKTRKKDTLRHGIGMESIKQVVDKYNGQMEYHFSKNHFTIELSLFPRE